MMPKWVPEQRGQRICAIVTMSDAQNDADVARSGKDVLQWTACLPEDCIRTMIQMGWDV